MKLLPQKTVNVRVTNKADTLADEQVLTKYNECNKEIGDNGRVLLRQSGTEPVVRIMAECETLDECDKYIKKIY